MKITSALSTVATTNFSQWPHTVRPYVRAAHWFIKRIASSINRALAYVHGAREAINQALEPTSARHTATHAQRPLSMVLTDGAAS